jgi:UDP-galactopyranose mutase
MARRYGFGSVVLACVMRLKGVTPHAGPTPEKGTSQEVRMSEKHIVCLSHLRWDFVYQRPQHLMSRLARDATVWFVEEPVPGEGPCLRISRDCSGVIRVVPVLPDPANSAAIRQQRLLLNELLLTHNIGSFTLWYYSPMALCFSKHLRADVTIYDCMDELSAFKDAPLALARYERELLRRADVVFTGGRSLHANKSQLHENVHCFPSAVDVQHFGRARSCTPAPDQEGLSAPRIGFAGVIDERMDLDLVAEVARARPTWQLIFVGPVAKIDEGSLPRARNIHYLGARAYEDLPGCMAAWDVAMIPFAMNEATRFISPTKTPEYLAAGLPVVSTPIRDVAEPYERLELAWIAGDAAAFVDGIERALACDREALRKRADTCLATISWDRTFLQMRERIDEASMKRQTALARHAVPEGGSTATLEAAGSV